ncbi:hypothetical protein RVR_3872 [Actinacidiphila reveromycinica]|uniref:Uncharacterized protein n=1 Tax=Actinacidiphila reveromycinica TaxID=659352 RepID=A0A7U3USG6_9ACTN|nr:hypothetical protein [Streptomyces sp. SN-593]BBA97901.1 hypothetical protein RVR_3872 [Streptomyces sp. SN-593]
MVRNIMGSLLALAGAAAAVWCPFRAWYDGRHGSDVRIDDLFTGVGVTGRDAALLGSLFLPMGFAALLTLLGVLCRSWAAVALAGCLVLGVTVLWMVRQAQFSGSLTAGGDGMDTGVGIAVGGGLLLFAAAFLLSGLRRPRYGRPDETLPPQEGAPVPDDPAAGGGAPHGTTSNGTADLSWDSAPHGPSRPSHRSGYAEPLSSDGTPEA